MRAVHAAGLGIGDEYPPRIMGVLNISQESPYKPSVFDDPGEAAAYVDEKLIGEGADIVDIGLESANKRYEVLSAEGELDRLDTAVETIESVSGDAVFSIETRYHEVAAAALDQGFDMVNDICGFADPELQDVCAERDVAVAKMASPPDLKRPGAVKETPWAQRRSEEWAERADYVEQVYEALKQNGFTDKTLIDPAFGGWSEAQTIEEDQETFRRLREFRGLGRPMLVSINRKNFLRSVAGRDTENALPTSLAATSMAVERGAHVIRTHDVAETRDAALIGEKFARERTVSGDSVALEELDVQTVSEAERHAERIGAHPGDVAGAALHVFELAGLSAPERDAVATASSGAGATLVPGSSGKQALLFGTEPALATVATAATGVSRGLDAALEALDERLS